MEITFTWGRKWIWIIPKKQHAIIFESSLSELDIRWQNPVYFSTSPQSPTPRFPTNPLFPPYPSSPNKSSLSFSSTLYLHCLVFFMWTTHLAIKKERNGYGSGTSLWNKLHIQVSLWFYYVCRLLCSRNILREFILWIGVFAFCFILFHFSLYFQQMR